MNLIKDKPQISHKEYRNMFVRIETPMMTCNKCNTSYPMIDGKIMCNGQEIRGCPYCYGWLKISNKTYGLRYEREEKKFWEGLGYTVLRSRGSFGLFDLIICNPNFWGLVSVKSTRTKNYNLKGDIENIGNFKNAINGTRKILVLYKQGKREIIFDKMI